MEDPVPVDFSNNTTLDITAMDQFIPKELQIPYGIAVVVLVIAIAFAFQKNQASKGDQMKELKFSPSSKSSFESPVKSENVTKTGTPIGEKTGTVMTPAGRRSARLARRKED